MNDENLVSLATRTQREKLKIAKKGAQKANKKKREKKAFSETVKHLLAMDATALADLVKLRGYGDDISNQMLLAVSMFETATEGGPQSVSAFNALLAASGEKTEKIEVSTIDKSVKEIQEYVKGGE